MSKTFNVKELISITLVGNLSLVRNTSDFDVVITKTPLKPKRKHIDTYLIPRQKSLIIEEKLDWSNHSISFKRRQEDE